MSGTEFFICTWRTNVKAKKLSQLKVRWLIGQIGSAETLVRSTNISEGLKPRKAASPVLILPCRPVLTCPVLSLSCPVLSCQIHKRPARLGLSHSTSSTDIFFFWDKINVSVGLVGVLTSKSQGVLNHYLSGSFWWTQSMSNINLHKNVLNCQLLPQ